MERFAIKIDKSVKARLKKLCRLCGIDNPNQIEILNADEWIDLTIDGEVPLNRKINECVGVEVLKNDRMPQRICALCVDKINDFYEFREMCQATNIQTRKLLNLPDITKIKASKKVTIKTEEDGVESILGISGDESAKEKVQKGCKKAKKGASTSTSTTTTSNDNRFRGMTKREIEITLELERIKREAEAETILKQPDATISTKNGKKRKQKPNVKSASDTALLAPKEPNQRERKREMEQKRIEKKRKTDTKLKAPLPKKIKKEPGVSCLVCEERFSKVTIRDAHLGEKHWPMITEYGCSSCNDQFSTLEENIAHNEWHFKTKTPYKCVICNVTFQKVNIFQKHQLDCSDPSFTSSKSFSCDIFCGLCNVEFETQNLYDWHSCFIGDNSPCPQCNRIFTKRTILFKHMFKCTGASSVVASLPAPKKVKAKAKKKTAKSTSKTKNKFDIPAQNSFKYEPETIIDQNVDGDDAFNTMDDSYMDTHFADSDNEYEPSNSIIPLIETVESKIPLPKDIVNEQTTENVISSVKIRPNLNHQLLECRVKLEPLDVSQLSSTIALNSAPSPPSSSLPQQSQSSQQPLTVPPLTIRIKKEVIRPGYGDEFDISVAHSIKQERLDETYELASTSTASTSTSTSHLLSHKKSKRHDKLKKLYKKPALLAIKIKQERMERETDDDDNDGAAVDAYNDTYQDYSMPSDDYSMEMDNQSFETNPLPIITQIHSVIEPASIVPLPNQQQLPIVTKLIGLSQDKTNVPFIPIRIKSEFQQPISPTAPPLPVIDSIISQQPINNSVSTVCDIINKVDSSKISPEYETKNEIENKPEQPEQPEKPEQPLQLEQPEQPEQPVQPEQPKQQIECAADISMNEVSGNQPLQMECDTRSEIIDEKFDQTSSMPNNSITDQNSQHNHDNLDKKVSENQSIEENDTASRSERMVSFSDDVEAVISTLNSKINHEDEIIFPNNINIANSECQSEVQKSQTDTHENKACKEDNITFIDRTSEIDTNVDSTSLLSINSSDDQNATLTIKHEEAPASSKNADKMLHPIEAISDDLDDNITIDPDIVNDASNISPLIDFIEPNANDDSLNFIDQLVHEVADSIVPQTSDDIHKNEFQNETVSIDTSHLPYDGTDLIYGVGDATNINVNENTEKTTIVESLLELPDIPDDLLPVLDTTDTQPNKNELNQLNEDLNMDNNFETNSTPATNDDIVNHLNNSSKLEQTE